MGNYAVMAGVAAGPAILLWWLFFSRAPWSERLGRLALMVAAIAGTRLIVHESIRTGAMGFLFPSWPSPTLVLAFVAWAVATRNLPDRTRRVVDGGDDPARMPAWTLVRTGGFTNDFDHDFAWRWSQTAEEQLLATRTTSRRRRRPSRNTGDDPAASQPRRARSRRRAAPQGQREAGARKRPARALRSEDGRGLAGLPRPASRRHGHRRPDPDRLGRVTARPDVEAAGRAGLVVLRGPGRPVLHAGAARRRRGGVLLQGEHRRAVWRHHDKARFWESNAGAGPRGTPTLANGRVYTFGGTGIVNVLDAGTGAVVWSRNAGTDTGAKLPAWGFASSPLVIDDVVVVAAAGHLVGYDAASGQPRWYGPKSGWGYSSPQLATIGGVPQVLLLNGTGAISVAPQDGKVLWEHQWHGDAIVQPGLTAEGDVLIGTATGMGDNAGIGMRRVALTQGPNGWTVAERWTTTAIKPYFNDFVVHNGYAYGFDGSLLVCVDLKDGERKWKGGRYGAGQLVLLPEQDLLLVLSEQGELALVKATPDQFTEVAARVPAIEGKTWNHPVLAGDVVLARNAEEMAAFRLKLAGH
jgi:outer membrane protein assembly factor BamB